MTERENSILERFGNRNPFRVPDGYFEGFADDLMNRLPDKTDSETKVISFYNRVKPWLYLAAMFAGIMVLFNIYNKSFMSDNVGKDTLTSVKVGLDDVEDTVFFEIIEDMFVDTYLVSYINDMEE